MVRRIWLIAVTAVLTAGPVAATDTFINLGFKTQTIGTLDLTVRSMGPVWVFAPTAERGFFVQLSPSIAVTGKIDGSPEFDFSDMGIFGTGMTALLGMGRNLQLGPLGMVLGAGLAWDVTGVFEEGTDNYFVGETFGVGGGARLYLPVAGSSLRLNVGLDGSWRPVGLLFSNGVSPELDLLWRTFGIDLNVGIGFEGKSRSEARTTRGDRPSLDDSMEGPRRRVALDTVVGGGTMASVRLWVFPVRDVWFVRAGMGCTVPSAMPLVVNAPFSLATGVYPFPRRLETFRVYIAYVDTVNLIQYVQGGGVGGNAHSVARTLARNFGIAIGAELNLSPQFGISVEPSFYPVNATWGDSERSIFQIALGVRVWQR